MLALAKTSQGPGGVELIERPQPVPAAREALISVAATGVCGTDLHIEAGEYETVVPVTLGHEIIGSVVAVGDGVDRGWIGERVVVETVAATCGACRWCRDGRPNLCPSRRSIGTHVDGGFASHLVAPVRNLHRVPDHVSDAAAVLAEPLACVCQAMLNPRSVAAGDTVLVTGPGPIGGVAALLAAACGASVTVTGLRSDERRLALLAALGCATSTGEPSRDHFDVTIEASGSAGGIQACLNALRRGGRHIQLGLVGRPASLDPDLIVLKELRLGGGFASTPRSWAQALRLLDARRVDPSGLLTEVASLSDWRQVFARLRAAEALKIALRPETDRADDAS